MDSRANENKISVYNNRLAVFQVTILAANETPI